jgi:hypothetical protein
MKKINIILLIIITILFARAWVAHSADLVVYVRTDSTTGGTGTEDTNTGANRAFASLADMQANIASSYKDLTDGGGDTLTVYVSTGDGTLNSIGDPDAYDNAVWYDDAGAKAYFGGFFDAASNEGIRSIGFNVQEIIGGGGAFTPDSRAEIWTLDVSNNLDVLLGTSATLSDVVVGWNDYTFSTAVQVASGTEYAYVFRRVDGQVSSTNYPNVLYATADDTFSITGETMDYGRWTVGGTLVSSGSGGPDNLRARIGLKDSTAVNLTGWTTSATNDLRIVQHTNDRHSGTYDTSKYRMEQSDVVLITSNVDHITFDGLQLYLTGVSGWNYRGISFGGGTATDAVRTIKNSIFRGSDENNFQDYTFAIVYYANDSTTLSGTSYIYNNLIYDWDQTDQTNGGVELWDCDTSNPITVYIYNNTFYDNEHGILLGSTFAGSCTVVASNNLMRATNGNEFYYYTAMTDFDSASDYNSASDSSGNYQAIDLNATKTSGSPWDSSGDADSDYFNNAASNDYRPAYGDLHLNVGADLSGTFTDDAVATTRPQMFDWDLGFYEYTYGTTTVTVDTDGVSGDYSTLSAAMSGESATTGNLIIKVQASTSVADSTTSQFAVPTMACDYLVIEAASTDRHSGIWDSSIYRLVIDVATQVVKWLWEDNKWGCPVKIDGLQVSLDGASYNGWYLVDNSNDDPETMTLENMIVRATDTMNYALFGGSSSAGHADRNVTVRNSVFYGASGNGGDTGTGTHIYGGTGTFTLENVTIFGYGTGGNGVMARHANVEAINVVARNNASGYGFYEHTTGSGGFTASSDYNSAEDSSATTYNATKTSGSPWNSGSDADSDFFLDAASDDFRPGSGDIHIDVGYDLSARFTDDAVGTTRGTYTEVGTDNFNRTNADPLDGDWVTLDFIADDLELVSNRVLSSSSQASGAYYSGGTPGANQYTQATLTDGNNRFGLATRITDSATGDLYIFQLTASTTATFYKLVSGSWTQIGSTINGTFSTSDVFRFEVEGTGSTTTLRAYQNGTLIATEREATGPHGSGYCGLYSHASTQAGFDDFSCGTLKLWTLGFYEYVAAGGAPTDIKIQGGAFEWR